MSKIKVQGNTSGTGTITLVTPATNSNRTVTLPDADGALLTNAGALSLFNASGSAPVFACRAWVNFNGSGTVSVRASGNVSSITDNGTGLYTMNFASSLVDANSSLTGVCREASSGYGDFVSFPLGGTYTSSAIMVRTTRAWNDTQNNNTDCDIVDLQVDR